MPIPSVPVLIIPESAPSIPTCPIPAAPNTVAITDEEAVDAFLALTKYQGIIPALETAHALAYLPKLSCKPEDVVVVNLSGRGDKDMQTYLTYLDKKE